MTAKARVDGTDFGTVFHTGATFFDYDKDGYWICMPADMSSSGRRAARRARSAIWWRRVALPRLSRGSPAVLYHNNRDGTFTNVTKAAGMFQPKGKNLSVAALDYDNDGWPDLFVANDGIEFYLYHNEQNGTFKESAFHAGIALMADGAAMAAMCISFGDYDNDGQMDLYVSDFQDVPDHVWRNEGKGFFEESDGPVGYRRAYAESSELRGRAFSTMTMTAGWTCSLPMAMFIRVWRRRATALRTSRSTRYSITKGTGSFRDDLRGRRRLHNSAPGTRRGVCRLRQRRQCRFGRRQ